MKNIHTLPTQNPSRLGLHQDNKLYLHDNTLTKNLPYFRPQNIYITSNEEIKERDSVILGGVLLKNIRPVEIEMYLDAKKIILTTDPELIKDGVQAIKNEFLEWFVKNPSCEDVEVEKEEYILQHLFKPQEYKFRYKIIIPKEEIKTGSLSESFENLLDESLAKGKLILEELKAINAKQESIEENHLEWIYNRMIYVHGENKNYDYMIKFKNIIEQLKKK
jgi:hypothetical protein